MMVIEETPTPLPTIEEVSFHVTAAGGAGAAAGGGVVRQTTKQVSYLYSRLKELSPTLRFGLEVVESRVPEPWLDKISAVSEPVICSLDSKIEDVSAVVSSKVLGPARSAYLNLDLDNDGRVSLADLSGVLAQRRAKVREDVVSRTKQTLCAWKSLRGDVSRKATERLERGFGAVREFSSTRGKEMFHVDLIEYSRQMLELTLPPLSEAMEKVASSLGQLEELVKEKSAQGLQQAEGVRAELRAKLRAAIEAGRDVSHAAIDSVHTHFEGVQTRLPHPVQLLVFQASEFLRSSSKLLEEVDLAVMAQNTLNSVFLLVKSALGVSQALDSNEN